MATNQDFNGAALARAKAELRPFQSNLMVETYDGSQLRGVWEGHRFVDYAFGDPMNEVRDFWTDARFPSCPELRFVE